jgi:cytosine/adenosine deaminase-related metal-dependent hydrolase
VPGLIDAHIHLAGINNLENLASYGVTTGLDMATWPLELLTSLRGEKGLTDIRSSGISATSPGSTHSHFVSKECTLSGPEEAKQFVAKRVEEGSDFIKITADVPGPGQETVNTLASEAK